MQSLEGEQVLLRIFVGESDSWHGRPLYAAIVEVLREAGVAGATVLRGIMGYGANSRIHRASLLDLSADLPIIIEAVDSEARIDQVMLKIDGMLHGGLITVERAHVKVYRGSAGPATPST